MKKIAGFVTALFLLVACGTSEKKTGEKTREDIVKDSLEKQKAIEDTASYTTIQWLDSTFKDMGKAKEGNAVKVSFRFKNTGEHPLVIANASASCGCTKPEKPEEPVSPGAEGVIKASFDSKNRTGSNRKSIFVDMNTKPSRSHTLEFEVIIE